MPSKLEELKAVIQKACPELMELTRGCHVWADGGGSDDAASYAIWEYIGDVDIVRSGKLWRCVFSTFATVTWSDQDILDGPHVVIGHPIRLSHVLRALRNNPRSFVGVDINGHFIDCDEEMVEWKLLDVRWDLANDTLELQSPETIDYLHELLCPSAASAE